MKMDSQVMIADRSGNLGRPPGFLTGNTHCCEPYNPRVPAPPPRPCDGSEWLLARVNAYLAGNLQDIVYHMEAFPEDFLENNLRTPFEIHAAVLMNVRNHLLRCHSCMHRTDGHLGKIDWIF